MDSNNLCLIRPKQIYTQIHNSIRSVYYYSSPLFSLTGVTLGGHMLLSSLNIILYLAGYNILPLEIHWFPVDLKVSDVTFLVADSATFTIIS